MNNRLNVKSKKYSAGLTKKNMGLLGVVVMSVMLSGCAEMNSRFDCPMSGGTMCKRVDEVNKMVDSGEVGKETVYVPTKDPKKAVLTVNGMGKYDNYSTPYPKEAFKPGAPLRYGEDVMRVWITNYEDSAGSYHEPSDVYVVVKPGHWIGNPPKSLKNDNAN